MAAADIIYLLVLAYGAFLLWSGFTAVRVLTNLVRPSRPAPFVCLHLTSIWMVGLAAMFSGLALLYESIHSMS